MTTAFTLAIGYNAGINPNIDNLLLLVILCSFITIEFILH